jgi:ABC-type sugar transport system substrate-binding protein
MEERSMKKLVALLLSAMMLMSMATGCGQSAPAGSAGAGSAAAAASTSAKKTSDLVVGFSTGAAGTTFRQEGIDDFTKIAEEYKAAGRIKDYKIVNNTTNWDANEQANIIRDFINDDSINVIVVNPNSPTDLNGVLAEAVAAGKTVVAADCEVDVDGVYCVSIDHYAWGERVASYICEALGGKGNVIQVYGGEGHPANNERIRATADVLAKYPNIKLISSTSGGWDRAVAAYVRLDAQFHDKIIEAADNSLLSKLWEQCNIRSWLFVGTSLAGYDLPYLASRHRLIYEELLKRDETRVADAVELHLNELLAMMKNREALGEGTKSGSSREAKINVE